MGGVSERDKGHKEILRGNVLPGLTVGIVFWVDTYTEAHQVAHFKFLQFSMSLLTQ